MNNLITKITIISGMFFSAVYVLTQLLNRKKINVGIIFRCFLLASVLIVGVLLILNVFIDLPIEPIEIKKYSAIAGIVLIILALQELYSIVFKYFPKKYKKGAFH